MGTGTTFGRWFRARREELKIGQAEIARLLELHVTTVSDVEHGRRTSFADHHHERIAEVLEVTVEEVERRVAESRPWTIDLMDAPPRVRELTLALARAVRAGDLGDEDADELLDELEQRRGGSES